jgi:hypothetical protein
VKPGDRAPTKTTLVHELERYMRVQGVFGSSGYPYKHSSGRATHHQHNGERSALDVVAGRAVNVKQEWERAKKLFRS